MYLLYHLENTVLWLVKSWKSPVKLIALRTKIALGLIELYRYGIVYTFLHISTQRVDHVIKSVHVYTRAYPVYRILLNTEWSPLLFFKDIMPGIYDAKNSIIFSIKPVW